MKRVNVIKLQMVLMAKLMLNIVRNQLITFYTAETDNYNANKEGQQNILRKLYKIVLRHGSKSMNKI